MDIQSFIQRYRKSALKRTSLIYAVFLLGLILSLMSGGYRLSNAAHVSSDAAYALSVHSQPITAISWSQTAEAYRGQADDLVLYCSSNGQLGDLWGSDVYADASSICTAAVHGGLITVENGGAIAIRLLPGQPSYRASTQNDVASDSLGDELGSFTFTTLHDPIAGTVMVDGQAVPIQVASWDTAAIQFADRVGDPIALYCPPQGELGLVWGDDIYRDASSVCSAAVHDSRITATEGGAIAFLLGEGRLYYWGSTRSGVTSRAFGAAPASFQFISFGLV